MKRKPWTPEDDTTLKTAVTAGRTYDDIAVAMDRSPSTIAQHAKQLGIAKRGKGKKQASKAAAPTPRKKRTPKRRQPSKAARFDQYVVTLAGQVSGAYGRDGKLRNAIALAATNFGEAKVLELSIRHPSGDVEEFKAGDDINELVCAARRFNEDVLGFVDKISE